MKAFIISVVAISLISILTEVILTEGQTKKYIQGIMSITVVLVLLTNVAALIKSQPSADIAAPAEETVNFNADTNVLNKLETARYELAAKRIASNLKSKGLDVEVTFVYGYGPEGLVFVQNIAVDVPKSVITEKEGNININDMIITACQNEIRIEKEGIFIYEV